MISIIILNFNRKNDILKTLDNILKYNTINQYEIILIDQNSTDGSVESINSIYPSVKLHCSKKNLGVAGGRNKGASLASGDILLFIDDDAQFKTKEPLNIIEEFFNQNPEIGIIGFKILDINDNIRDWVYNRGCLKYSDKSFYSQQYVGCGHAIRRDLFETVNGYSESLFFWGEEIEFCLKTYRDTNYKILYYPKIEIIHRVSPISRYHWKTDRTTFKTRNRFVLIFNYFPKNSIYFYLFIIYFLFGYLLKSITNKSTTYFLKGLKQSFNHKISEKKLSNSQIKKYSMTYFKQYFGKPDFYINNQ